MGAGKAGRILVCLIPFCYIFIALSAPIFAGFNSLWAQEQDERRAEVNYLDTSSAERQGKEGDMADADRLTEEEGRYLLTVARKTIEQRLFNRTDEDRTDKIEPPIYSERRGTFVTLTIDGRLRGCIGHIIPRETLIEGVRINAINAAFQDPRFSPVSGKEWERVKIEVSILTDPKPLPYADADDLLKKLRAGIDGVIIKQGFRQATFLPQVWEQIHDNKEFLTHLCLKAGLQGAAWKKERLEVYTYQVQAFEEH